MDELCAAAKISRSTYTKIENGECRSPRPTTMKRIADALGVEVMDIMVDDEGKIVGAVGKAISSEG